MSLKTQEGEEKLERDWRSKGQRKKFPAPGDEIMLLLGIKKDFIGNARSQDEDFFILPPCGKNLEYMPWKASSVMRPEGHSVLKPR